MIDLLDYSLRILAVVLALLGAVALLGGAALVGWRQIVRRRRAHANDNSRAVQARVAGS